MATQSCRDRRPFQSLMEPHQEDGAAVVAETVIVMISLVFLHVWQHGRRFMSSLHSREQFHKTLLPEPSLFRRKQRYEMCISAPV
ncbi:hypothetical protein NDU88_010463 [Pleurodeles waltl]|uniref:Uncharacterized protein n=1 Tax=Pleurodeles waltl TaxID=8319 RepID=A0AAV7QY37_PLEWA|nr:hypothetical protein NDU88_010463 [Pleurodeles waltl]